MLQFVLLKSSSFGGSASTLDRVSCPAWPCARWSWLHAKAKGQKSDASTNTDGGSVQVLPKVFHCCSYRIFSVFFPKSQRNPDMFHYPRCSMFLWYDNMMHGPWYIFLHIRVIFGVNVEIFQTWSTGVIATVIFLEGPWSYPMARRGKTLASDLPQLKKTKICFYRVILSSYHWIILDMLDGKSQHHIKTAWCHIKNAFFSCRFFSESAPWPKDQLPIDPRLGVDVDLQEGQDLVAVDLEGEPTIMGLQSVYKTLGRSEDDWLRV